MARKGAKDRGVSQRKGKKGWWCTIVVNGQKKLFCCDSKSQAVALHGRLRGQIREGTYFPEKFAAPDDITLRAWIARYLDGCTNQGIKNERRYGRRWSLLLGKRLLSHISLEELRRVQAKMKANGRWSGATINRHFAFIRRLLQFAVTEGKLLRNPALQKTKRRDGVPFFPEANSTRFLSEQELGKLQQLMKPEDWNLVALAVETGLRRQEQFGLRWNQVDLEAGVITIPLPKGGETRHVPLSEGAKGLLRSLDSFVRSPWVFPSPKNSLLPRNPQSFINHVYTPALRQAGISGVCWHSLRHTAASRRIQAGVTLLAVQEILGHVDIQTTLRYSHLTPGHLQEAVNRGSLFGSDTASDTNSKQNGPATLAAGPQLLEGLNEAGWLGD